MNKMRKLLCICLAALTVAAGAAFAVAAATTSATQFADNKDVIAYQKSIKELEAKQKDLKDKLKNVQNNRYTAQQKSAYYNELILSTEKKIETAQNLLDALTVQIGEKENAIAEKEVEITEKTAEVNTTREKFLLMIRAQYESENTDALSVVVGADDMSDLLSRVENAANLLSYNSKLLEKFKCWNRRRRSWNRRKRSRRPTPRSCSRSSRRWKSKRAIRIATSRHSARPRRRSPPSMRRRGRLRTRRMHVLKTF